jgi:hypothetical protein
MFGGRLVWDKMFTGRLVGGRSIQATKSVNEMVTQNIPQHLFLQTGKEGNLGHICDTELVRKVAFYEFDGNYRFLTTSCVPYMGHTIRHFTLSLKKK